MAETGLACNGANPNMLRMNLPKLALAKLEENVNFDKNSFLREKIEFKLI